MTIQDLEARQQALNPTESFIVQAPAGSGKTELLTQRYLKLLTANCQQPENIIAITFTRKAAREMKERIIQSLHNAATQAEPTVPHEQLTWRLAQAALKKDAALQWNIVLNPNRLNILTIDSLTSTINAKTPLLSGMGIQPTLLENATPYYEQAVASLMQCLAEEPAHQYLLTTFLLHVDNKMNKASSLLCELLGKREQWLNPIMQNQHQSDELKHQLEHALNQIISESLSNLMNNMPAGILSDLILLSQHAGNNLTNTTDSAIDLASMPDVLLATSEYFKYWKAIANMLLTQKGEWRKSITKRQGFIAKSPEKNQICEILKYCSTDESLRQALNDLLICPTPKYSPQQWDILTTLITLLPLLVAHLSLIFQQCNVIDFVELNLAALRALGDDTQPTDLAIYMDNKITHLLIDEFQDTSITHFKLLEKMIAEWFPGDGRTLFLVGDPMQSIYRFRDAEVNLFMHAQKNGIGQIGLTPLTLTMNFRSAVEIVEWVNQSFKAIFPSAPDFIYGGVPLSKAIPAKTNTQGSIKLFSQYDDEEDLEAEKIATTIKSIQKKHPKESIAILVRARNQLINIIKELQKQKLEFHAVDIDPLELRYEIQDLLSLTRALLHRNDRIAWLSILRAPWCGLTLNDMHIISQSSSQSIWTTLSNSDSTEYLSDDGRNRLARIMPILKQAISHIGRKPLSHIIQFSWLGLGGPATLQQPSDIEHCDTYFKCIEIIEDEYNNIDLCYLTQKLSSLYAKPMQTALNAVQIMTIHKSKGLEFDHVIIPQLHKGISAEKNTLLMWTERPNQAGNTDLLLAPIKASDEEHNSIYQYLRHMNQQKTSFEAGRLFYVGVTRAKKHLYLSTTLNRKHEGDVKLGSTNSFLSMIYPLYQQQLIDNAQTMNHQPVVSIAQQEEHESRQSLQRLTAQWKLPLNHPYSTLFNPLANTINYKQQDIDLTFSDHKMQYFGIALHLALEHFKLEPNKSIDTLVNDKPLRQLLQSNGYLKNEIDSAIKTIKQALLLMSQDTMGQWILSGKHQPQHNEFKIYVKTEKSIEQQIIDRVFIDDDTVYIVDYKSATPQENQTNHQFLAEALALHQKQLEQYAKSIAKIWPKHNIQLILYFPLCQLHIKWEFLELESMVL